MDGIMLAVLHPKCSIPQDNAIHSSPMISNGIDSLSPMWAWSPLPQSPNLNKLCCTRDGLDVTDHLWSERIFPIRVNRLRTCCWSLKEEQEAATPMWQIQEMAFLFLTISGYIVEHSTAPLLEYKLLHKNNVDSLLISHNKTGMGGTNTLNCTVSGPESLSIYYVCVWNHSLLHLINYSLYAVIDTQ